MKFLENDKSTHPKKDDIIQVKNYFVLGLPLIGTVNITPSSDTIYVSSSVLHDGDEYDIILKGEERSWDDLCEDLVAMRDSPPPIHSYVRRYHNHLGTTIISEGLVTTFMGSLTVGSERWQEGDSYKELYTADQFISLYDLFLVERT